VTPEYALDCVPVEGVIDNCFGITPASGGLDIETGELTATETADL